MCNMKKTGARISFQRHLLCCVILNSKKCFGGPATLCNLDSYMDCDMIMCCHFWDSTLLSFSFQIDSASTFLFFLFDPVYK